MSSLGEFPEDPSASEEFRFLCMLHNIGATRPEKSLSVEEISRWVQKDHSVVTALVQKLVEMGYVQSIQVEGVNKYHVTLNGLRKVLSLYS